MIINMDEQPSIEVIDRLEIIDMNSLFFNPSTITRKTRTFYLGVLWNQMYFSESTQHSIGYNWKPLKDKDKYELPKKVLDWINKAERDFKINRIIENN